MDIYFDISKLVAETLKNYPSCTHLQNQFEVLLQRPFEELKSKIEDSHRVGGLSEVKAFYEALLKNHKTDFLQKEWLKINVFSGGTIDEYKAKAEILLQFLKSAVDWFEKNEERHKAVELTEPSAGKRKRDGKETQRCYALHHYYLQKAEIEPIFTQDGRTKKEAIAGITESLGISHKGFERMFNQVSAAKPNARTSPKHIKDLRRVVELLGNDPLHKSAKAIAEDELTIAESKKT